MATEDAGTRRSCEECGTPLAADQAYCLVCGARARPIPARVAVAISDIEDHGHAIAPDDPILAASEAGSEDEDEGARDDLVSSARAGVIALLAMLAVGVVIGGLTS